MQHFPLPGTAPPRTLRGNFRVLSGTAAVGRSKVILWPALHNSQALQTIFTAALAVAGILSGTPRGEMVGTARFTDASHGLVCDVAFGKAEGASPSDKLLNRSDTTTATLSQLDRSATSASGQSPPEASQASLSWRLFPDV